MKPYFLVLVIYVCSLSASAQETPSRIDTTGLKYSEELYLHDLIIEESENKNIVILKWKEHRDVKNVVIELRDLKTKELFNREKYAAMTAELPVAAQYTLYPISYTKKGEALTTTLADFKSNKSKPLHPKSFKKILKEKELQRKRKEERKQQALEGVFSYIDTTTYVYSDKLYFHNLFLEPSPHENKVLLSWEKQRNIRFLMIELRDLKTKKLFYRDKHYMIPVELPANAEYTVYPVYYKQKGEAIITTLADFKANGAVALNPQSYFNAKKKQRQYELRKQRAAAKNEMITLQRARAADERANRITPKVIILIGVVVFLSIIIVVGVWLVGRLTKHKDPNANMHQQNSGGWD